MCLPGRSWLSKTTVFLGKLRKQCLANSQVYCISSTPGGVNLWGSVWNSLCPTIGQGILLLLNTLAIWQAGTLQLASLAKLTVKTVLIEGREAVFSSQSNSSSLLCFFQVSQVVGSLFRWQQNLWWIKCWNIFFCKLKSSPSLLIRRFWSPTCLFLLCTHPNSNFSIFFFI